MSKKIYLLYGLIFLGFLFLNNISAADMCWVETNAATCILNTGHAVMRVSDTTNAHGELASQTNYERVVCCNFGAGGTSCASNNLVLRISSQTNAHAESPSLMIPNYNVNVCYDSLQNGRRVDAGVNCNTLNNEIPVVYISNITNAHLEGSGLSPQNYASKICAGVNLTENPPTCTITSASWSTTSASTGTSVHLNVATSNCVGQQLSFEVFRNRPLLANVKCSDISGCTNPSNAIVGSNGAATGTWTAGPADDNNYYFVAQIGTTNIMSDNELTVTEELPQSCTDLNINICSNYRNYGTGSEDACNNDLCSVADNSVPTTSLVDCSDSSTDCFCSWNSATSNCEAGWKKYGGECGDGNVGPGEQCDDHNTANGDGCSSTCTLELGISCNNNDVLDTGEFCDTTKLNGKDCIDFGFDSPNTLSCNSQCGFDTSQCNSLDGFCGDGNTQNGETCEKPGSYYIDHSDWGSITQCSDFGDTLSEGTGLICGENCQFNTSSPYCTGIPGVCNDGVINPGETCDRESVSLMFTCNDFNAFTGGTLSCDSECQIDTLRCEPSSIETGTCYYEEETTDTCDDDGYLTVNLVARWDGALNDPLADECKSSTEALQCPAQVALPFFGFYNLLAALVLIAAIYLITETRRKKK
jgi:cysteine-rich repeat protein